MNKTLKITLTATLVAIGVVTSNLISIPIGFTKVFPIQHMINVLSAVLLGPMYAVIQAFSISLIRNLMGTGSLFAFPGSMIGAFLAAFLYAKTNKLSMAVIGEVIGTGILGAMACYPISVWILGKEAALFGFIPSFIFSSIAGAIIGYLLLKVIMRNPAFIKFIERNK